jgi:hypothetical protein
MQFEQIPQDSSRDISNARDDQLNKEDSEELDKQDNEDSADINS